jgi:hypothetical protein
MGMPAIVHIKYTKLNTKEKGSHYFVVFGYKNAETKK